MAFSIDAAFIIKAIIILLIFAITLLIATYSTYAERKVAAFIQDRIGPNRAGPFGLLQPIADAVKMFFKEDFIPSHASKWLFILGPCLSMRTALMTRAVIPFGDSVKYEAAPGKVWDVAVQAIDVNIGITLQPSTEASVAPPRSSSVIAEALSSNESRVSPGCIVSSSRGEPLAAQPSQRDTP